MSDYATVQNVIDLFRPLSVDEQARVEKIIPLVCDALRYEADKVNKNLDEMIAQDPKLLSIAQMVTVDIVSRILRQDISVEPMSQYSQSALGYSVSGSPVMAGGGIGAAILKNDLKRLGLKRQRYGALEIYD